ncbi:hematopoietic prostaglandin D synthase-like [Pecten maximus]|uniref:hematopoietic prostaglandin D synthase-like n=1 Tax=Pecten maximus TaxID=6579 RepID=UPI001458DA3B|nr:hematopoietic prostaglandin D synthase-like [Pecten maximus]
MSVHTYLNSYLYHETIYIRVPQDQNHQLTVIQLRTPVYGHPPHNMPAYKLTYFTVRGRGELIRLALETAGKSYEEVKVTFADWPALKPNMPTGQLPVLEVDGKQLVQSLAIARYLGKEFGMAGECSMEQCLVDQVIDTGADGLTAYVKWYFEKDEEKKAELKKELVETTIPKFAQMFTTFLENSGGKNGFFVGSKLTLADLACHEAFTDFLQLNADALNDFPKLAANRQKVEENETLKQYLAKRPESVI